MGAKSVVVGGTKRGFTFTPTLCATFSASTAKVSVADVSTVTKRFSFLCNPAATPAPPRTSVSPEFEENESGFVRSKREPPAVKMPGSCAAFVPLVNVPLDPKSASEPLLFASSPHCSAELGSDLSSHSVIAIGLPSAHWLLTAFGGGGGVLPL